MDIGWKFILNEDDSIRMEINITLKFNEVPVTSLAMAGQRCWMAILGGYIWLIFLDEETKLYVAAFRNRKSVQGGISSNPMTVIQDQLASFDEAAKACAIMYMKMADPGAELKH